MSSRILALPDQALLGLLNGFQRRLFSLQSRSMFPGSVSQAEVPGPVAVPIFGSPATLASLQLDAGRWLIIGGFRSASTSPGGDVPYFVRSQIVTPVGTSANFEVGHPNPGPVTVSLDCSMPIWSASLAAPGTVSLRVQRSSNLLTCNASEIYLIACPS